jgi:3-hydroxyanthranilate 3,4-dioxygenase
MDKGFFTFAAAAEAGPWDERPMLPPGTDPQLHLSRSDRPQPFFLICEKDTVLAQMSGTGRVEYPTGPVRWHTLEPGDFVYVPGGTPHRIVPTTECIQFRFKPDRPGLEGVAWYCPACGAEVHRDEWDTKDEVSQAAWLRFSEAFDADEALRTCRCGAVHPRLDLSGNRWATLAAGA